MTILKRLLKCYKAQDVHLPLTRLCMVLCFKCGFIVSTVAQGGLIFDDAAYANFPAADAGVKNEVLPAAYSLRKYCPFPKSQGNIASCVGWTVGYGALTITEAKKQGITDRTYITDEMSYSASYIFNQIKKGEDCNAGASLTDALELLQKQGDCRTSTFPNNPGNCKELPQKDAQQEASRNKLPSTGFKLFASKATISDKVKTTKAQLYRGNPVIIGFSVTPQYHQLLGKSVWQPDNDNKEQGHAMVVVGYSDRLQAFELMNSFGTRWGDGGFIWLTYEDFGEYARQGFVLYQKDGGKGKEGLPTSELSVTMSGGWQLQYASDFRTTPVKFDTVATTFNAAGIYQVQRQDWTLNEDLFRMQLHISEGRYAYFFNMNTAGEADSLWAMEALDQDTLLTLPPKGYFQFSKAGEESLCLLISYEKIENFTECVRKAQYAVGSTALQKIRNGFEATLIDAAAIQYDKASPFFQSVSRYGQGIAVPIVLSIQLRE